MKQRRSALSRVAIGGVDVGLTQDATPALSGAGLKQVSLSQIRCHCYVLGATRI